MPVESVTQARDEMSAVFRLAWCDDMESVDVPVLWPDVAEEIPTDRDHWARFNLRHSEGAAATLPSGTGQRRYRHGGTVTIQIFTKQGDGQRTADALSKVAKDAFEGVVTAPGGVIFRRVRINEIGPDGAWFQTNVLADFEYDEVK